MVEQIFAMFTASFGSVAGWFTAFLDRVGMTGIVIIAVVTVLAISILLMPLRGGSSSSFTSDYNKNSIHSKSNSKR